MLQETSSRFNWRIHPRPTPRPKQPASPIPEPPTVSKWADHEPAAYVDGTNWYIVQGDNPINAVNPLGT